MIYDATWADPQQELLGGLSSESTRPRPGVGPNDRGGEAISFGPVPFPMENEEKTKETTEN